MTGTEPSNPFADLAVKALTIEQQQTEFRQGRKEALDRQRAQEAELADQRRKAVLRDKEREQLRAKIRSTLQVFTRTFTGHVKRSLSEFVSGPKAWSPQDFLEAGNYVTFLTTPVVKGVVPTAPSIKDSHAKLIREKFVWGLLLAQHANQVTIPDNALVGQTQEWYIELVAGKRSDFDAWVARQTAASSQPKTSDEQDAQDEEEDSTSNEPLTDEKLKQLAGKFSPEARTNVVELRPAITLPQKREDAKSKAKSRKKIKTGKEPVTDSEASQAS